MPTTPFADLAYVEKALSEPVDIEREVWRAARKRYVPAYVGGRWTAMPVWRDPFRASGYTGTYAETLYASVVAGNNLATFTTEAIMYATTQPECLLPASFFDSTYGVNKTLRIVCRGVYSTTSTPTFTVGLRTNTTGDSTTSSLILGSSLAITSQSSVTNLPWELECDVTASSLSLASSHNEAVLFCMGFVSGVSTGSNGFTNASAIGTQTPTTALTLTQSDVAQFLIPTITCGTSSASNKWQMLQMIVMGLN